MSKNLIWRKSKPSKQNNEKNLLPLIPKVFLTYFALGACLCERSYKITLNISLIKPQISKHLPRLRMKTVYKSAASSTLPHTGFKACYIFYFQVGYYNQMK